MVQRGGQVVIRMLENVSQVTIQPLIQATITLGTLVLADEYDIYCRLPAWGYEHKTAYHGAREYARDEDGEGFQAVHVNTIEGFWSMLRSWGCSSADNRKPIMSLGLFLPENHIGMADIDAGRFSAKAKRLAPDAIGDAQQRIRLTQPRASREGSPGVTSVLSFFRAFSGASHDAGSQALAL